MKLSKVILKPVGFMLFFVLLFFLIYTGIIIYNIWPIESTTLSQAGSFGDAFGVLTSLFSALAFGGLMITIWQQQQEIDINRQDSKIQHFENVLFKMMEMLNEMVSDFDVQRINKVHISGGDSNNEYVVLSSGRDCFYYWYTKLKKSHDQVITTSNRTRRKNRKPIELVNNFYGEFWKGWSKDLGHYFRFLYRIMRYIDDSDMEDKKKYTNILRAQFSDYSLVLLFYNCLHSNGVEKFKPLCEKYEIFNNLPDDLLYDKGHKSLYESTAFGSVSLTEKV
ncbi:putative phage abortive infection protein [Thalassolituus pacificus]|uniref:Phage abortive infection protein n=1 Tax=Thalassolituus pacificus TaxID=2975440 RepID=A0A9X2WDT8_9GAMM|nr:putative phage abortive infection protein [Thalassolituus pacificus]MCT7358599.1 putative phage abortive infection protein [Thalassolituus pacificus]